KMEDQISLSEDLLLRHQAIGAEEIPVEIWNQILTYLNDEERLNLRACSRRLTDIISRTDMHSTWPYSRITTGNGQLLVRVSKFIEMKANCDGQGLDQILHIPNRLFSRMYGELLTISEVNFNIVPAKFIESLLERSRFTTLSFIFREEEFNIHEVIQILRKLSWKSVQMTFVRFTPDEESLETIKQIIH
ncbi:hypothetical protein PMAYCL1PPCAC_05111, partial [Pristionchus mayeri]